jgi:peptide subunit release factor 1 (eRF1)
MSTIQHLQRNSQRRAEESIRDEWPLCRRRRFAVAAHAGNRRFANRRDCRPAVSQAQARISCGTALARGWRGIPDPAGGGMLSSEDVEQLERFDGAGARVLSLYLNLDPTRQVTRSYRIELKDLVREASATLTKAERNNLASEVGRAAEFLDRPGEPQGRGLILFSCAPRDLWLARFVSVPVRDHLAFDVRPDIAGLLELVDDYERFAVVLVSKDKARVFTVFAGAIEEIDAFEDFVPGKTDAGALKQSKIQRHHELHVLWHLENVVAKLSKLHSRRHFDRLIIMGPVEATTELQQILPHVLETRVAAVVRAEEDITNAEILEKALDVERRIEADAEDRLVGQVVETARSGGRATCGIDPTLEALWLGDIRTLVIAEALRLTGTECSNCGRLHSGNISICPACGGPARTLPDFSHQIMGRAAAQRARVEVVHSVAAERLNEAGQGLAAFLRFPWPARIREKDDVEQELPERIAGRR